MNQHNPTSGDASPTRWPWFSRDLGLGRNNGILFWVHLIWGAGFTIQAALWTIFIEDLGASPTQIGLVVGGGAVVRTLLAIPAGILADRFPLKPVIISMMAVPILGAIALALATEWWHALAGAVLMDMSGVAIPAVSAYVAAASKPEDRTRTMTYIFSMSWLISMAVAPAIGGVLADSYGFRVVYIAGAVLFAIGIVFATRIDDIRPARDTDDAESKHQSSGYRQLLASTGVRVVLGFHLLVPLIVFTAFALLPNFMHDERGVSIATIGILASAGAVVAFGASLLVSHWKPLTRPFMGMTAILTIAATSMALMLAFTALPIVALRLHAADVFLADLVADGVGRRRGHPRARPWPRLRPLRVRRRHRRHLGADHGRRPLLSRPSPAARRRPDPDRAARAGVACCPQVARQVRSE